MPAGPQCWLEEAGQKGPSLDMLQVGLGLTVKFPEAVSVQLLLPATLT